MKSAPKIFTQCLRKIGYLSEAGARKVLLRGRVSGHYSDDHETLLLLLLSQISYRKKKFI